VGVEVFSLPWELSLEEGLVALGLELGTFAKKRLTQYVRLLDKWNRIYNLTGVRDPLLAIPRHILDSLSVLPYLDGARVLDVGSGAGLPGIPLAIASSDRQFVLLDKGAKKIRFLTQVACELSLVNVTSVHSRLQDYQPPHAFVTVIARAFAPVERFVASAGHLCSDKGRILAMTGPPPVTTRESLPAGYRLQAVFPLKVPGLCRPRHLVWVTHV
jgi:16S rRNA (guanine(527)-N(7))-methyltransferase GidB